MRLYRNILFILTLSVASAASATRMSVYDAESAARAFAADGHHLAVGIGSFPREVREHPATDGSSFFSVRMCGGGTLFLSGDDRFEPVIAFSSSDIDFDKLDRNSPLYALLNGDSRVRRGTSAAKAKWNRLLSRGDALPVYPSLLALNSLTTSLSIPGDVRVPALVGSKWNQDAAGGGYCYNYYTPDHRVCGCVATAMSQIMRYHRWPDADHPVLAKTVECGYGPDLNNFSSTNLTMQGGVYAWASMPLATSADPITTVEQRRAIGKLTSDAGISVEMVYTVANGSATYNSNVPDALMENWHYGQATYLYDFTEYDYGYIDGEHGEEARRRLLQSAFFSNLDNGYPVMLGISGSVGHSIVADGYGYDSGVDYVHLNMGWSGLDDFWYNLPAIGASGQFDSVSDAVYNIFPTNGTDCAALSGRVIDADSQGLSAARVRIYRSGTSDVVAETESSATGVYGAILSGGKSYDIVAVSADLTMTGRLSRVSLPRPAVQVYWGQCTRVVYADRTIGNSWGNDLLLVSSIRTAPTNFYVSASSAVDAPDRGTSAAPYATIQYAITNGQLLVDGDVINVRPGTYYGCVETPATAISIVSTDGPATTAIDGEGRDCCYCGSANQQNLLSGFTMTNGAYFGGIYFGVASNCVIRNCQSGDAFFYSSGGGAYSAVLKGCVLRNNDADYGGGAASCILSDCTIYGNTAYFGGGASQSVLTNCLVAGNAAFGFEVWGRGYDGGRGGGVYECDIVNCTLADNVADFYGGGAYLHQFGEARNSIVCGNTNRSGSASGNDVYGDHYWTMSNSFSDVDAGFRDAEQGDYRLRSSSPAVDAGSVDFVSVDHDLDGTNRVWGAAVDAGCYEYHLPSGITDPTEIGVAAALSAEGYRAEYAAAVTTPKDCAFLTEWTAKNRLSAEELNASSTGFVSPALNAEGLLDLDPTNIVLESVSPSASGVWNIALSLPGYDRADVNIALLRAAVGIVGSENVRTGYSTDNLEYTVTPSSTNILVTVTPPSNVTNYFMKATVR